MVWIFREKDSRNDPEQDIKNRGKTWKDTEKKRLWEDMRLETSFINTYKM
jgi:hypothetical protein